MGERHGVLIQFCGAERVVALLGGFRLAKFLAENDGVGLALDGFADSGGGGIILRRHDDRQSQQCSESEVKMGGFYHGKIWFNWVKRFGLK